MAGYLRRKLKSSFDRLGNESLKKNFLQALPFWLASLIAGIVAVVYAKLFVYAEMGTSFLVQHQKWSLLIITPLSFLLAWWLVIWLAPYARGSGIPQVMASIELETPKSTRVVQRFLSLRIILVKMFSSLVMIFGGGVIGREGPTIQISGSIFKMVNEALPAWWPKTAKKNMIMTGAAAGLAAAFNTPLGGIVFAVEELTKTHLNYFKTALFTAVIITGLTAQGLLGPYLYLGFPDVSGLPAYIFIWVGIVAVISGLAGSIMGKGILAIMRWKSSFRFRWQQMLFVLGAALAIAALAVFFDESILGSGKKLMTDTLFTNQKYLSIQTPFLRIFGLILSFSTGAAGGVFAPSLSCGASIGSVLAGIVHLSAANANVVILSGMVGFLTGVTRSPFTSATLVLEMTDRHNVIFHLMIAGMLASMVALLVDNKSFYDRLKDQYLEEVKEQDSTAPAG